MKRNGPKIESDSDDGTRRGRNTPIRIIDVLKCMPKVGIKLFIGGSAAGFIIWGVYMLVRSIMVAVFPADSNTPTYPRGPEAQIERSYKHIYQLTERQSNATD